jgi:hypothetical protein
MVFSAHAVRAAKLASTMYAKKSDRAVFDYIKRTIPGFKTAQFFRGAYKSVLVSRSFVLKLALQSDDELIREFNIVTKFRSQPKYRKYFPQTQNYRSGKRGMVVQLQERIKLSADMCESPERRGWQSSSGFNVFDPCEQCSMCKKTQAARARAERIAYDLDIDDIHVDNYGVKQDPRTKRFYPVFIDVGGAYDSCQGWGDSDNGSFETF